MTERALRGYGDMSLEAQQLVSHLLACEHTHWTQLGPDRWEITRPACGGCVFGDAPTFRIVVSFTESWATILDCDLPSRQFCALSAARKVYITQSVLETCISAGVLSSQLIDAVLATDSQWEFEGNGRWSVRRPSQTWEREILQFRAVLTFSIDAVTITEVTFLGPTYWSTYDSGPKTTTWMTQRVRVPLRFKNRRFAPRSSLPRFRGRAFSEMNYLGVCTHRYWLSTVGWDLLRIVLDTASLKAWVRDRISGYVDAMLMVQALPDSGGGSVIQDILHLLSFERIDHGSERIDHGSFDDAFDEVAGAIARILTSLDSGTLAFTPGADTEVVVSPISLLSINVDRSRGHLAQIACTPDMSGTFEDEAIEHRAIRGDSKDLGSYGSDCDQHNVLRGSHRRRISSSRRIPRVLSKHGLTSGLRHVFDQKHFRRRVESVRPQRWRERIHRSRLDRRRTVQRWDEGGMVPARPSVGLEKQVERRAYQSGSSVVLQYP